VNFNDSVLLSNVEISTHPGNVDLKLLTNRPTSGLQITNSWAEKFCTLNSKVSYEHAY